MTSACTPPGKFIVLEGAEGSGKSTQAALLSIIGNTLLTREPGGVPGYEQIRTLVLDPNLAWTPRTIALLMAADRAQHVDMTIKPALTRGQNVVCDRYIGSSIAIQGYAQGLGAADIEMINRWATANLEPDLVIYIKIPPEIANARRLARSGYQDRFELETARFHAAVAQGLETIEAAHHNWTSIDGDGPIHTVHTRVIQAIHDHLGPLT